MKINDVNLIEIIVTKDGQEIYSGQVNDAPDEIKALECKKVTFDSNKMKIEV